MTFSIELFFSLWHYFFKKFVFVVFRYQISSLSSASSCSFIITVGVIFVFVAFSPITAIVSEVSNWVSVWRRRQTTPPYPSHCDAILLCVSLVSEFISRCMYCRVVQVLWLRFFLLSLPLSLCVHLLKSLSLETQRQKKKEYFGSITFVFVVLLLILFIFFKIQLLWHTTGGPSRVN